MGVIEDLENMYTPQDSRFNKKIDELREIYKERNESGDDKYYHYKAKFQDFEGLEIGKLMDLPVFTNDQEDIENARGKVTGVQKTALGVEVTVRIEREAFPHLCRGLEEEYISMFAKTTPTMSCVVLKPKED